MSKNLLSALLLIALLVLVFIFNTRGHLTIDIGITDFRVVKSIAFFIFSAVGVLIGVLIR
ncbi:MAG: hypothetical protein KAH23_06965 [Kiritimatiellae bacterium]|nr:hypothetical protein [Kiritimatiellia bacterium]